MLHYSCIGEEESVNTPMGNFEALMKSTASLNTKTSIGMRSIQSISP